MSYFFNYEYYFSFTSWSKLCCARGCRGGVLTTAKNAKLINRKRKFRG